MSDKYILDGKTPVPVDDVLEWGKAFEKQDRTVAKTEVGKARVSTVFLGLDQSFGRGAPELFETMVFGRPENDICERYSTWEEAEAGHAAIVAKLQGAA